MTRGEAATTSFSVYMESGWSDPGVETCLAPAGEVDVVTQVHLANPSICQGIIPFADPRLGSKVELLLQRYAKTI